MLIGFVSPHMGQRSNCISRGILMPRRSLGAAMEGWEYSQGRHVGDKRHFWDGMVTDEPLCQGPQSGVPECAVDPRCPC